MDKLEKKVLIVEDSGVLNKLLVHSVTTQLHIPVESAKSMAEAKEMLERDESSFFIAIVDLNLPDAENGEIVDLVIKYNIPPIILTGSGSDSLYDEMAEKPIVDYVVKRNMNEIEYIIQTIRRFRENEHRKALVVDDSKSSRKLISTLLKRHNLYVLEAEDAETALRIMHKHNDISLMITDLNMPGMDGIELTIKVRESFPSTDVAIIGISTSRGGLLSSSFLKSGANDFIAKPFIYEEFYCRVNQYIDVIASYKKLKDVADHDYLTGLHNRAYLFGTGEKLLQNAQRKNITISIGMIDIDHFKQINDTYGHYVGDEVLKHISTILTKKMRESDVLTRVGGEEFCLMCVNLEKKYAPKLFERFRKTVAENPLMIDDMKIEITISIGYTMKIEKTLEDMIKIADSALYSAKNGGRNQVAVG